MKKQIQKIKIAAENFSQRGSKPDKNDDLQHIERQCEKYREVLQTIVKKVSPGADALRDKRLKKVHEYILGQTMDESAKELPDGTFKRVLEDCGRLEKTIATEIVTNEENIEKDVSKNLNNIIETHIATVQKQKRIVHKCHQDNETAKQKYQNAIRLNENPTKLNQLKDDQEECESKLEKERDIYASNMFDLLAEEDNISSYIIKYVKNQQLFYKSALDEIEDLMGNMNTLIRTSNKRVFSTSLEDHLGTTGRKISSVIELCVCCLLEKGLYEEGLLRVGCGKSKLMRMRSALDADFITAPIPPEYLDVHVVASVLKNYLRSLPEPMLTFKYYQEIMDVSQIMNEPQRKTAILNILNKLPEGNYNNFRYLMKFLTLLSEKNQRNKMSTSNIAIVMSPNLLWSQNENEQDYAQQVSSTSAVNTVVDTIISDWDYFFQGEVNFYEKFSRDELFPDNGGFPVDRDASVLQSSSSLSKNSIDQMSVSMIVGGESVKNGPPIGHSKMAHSRSSSHDTSLILLSENQSAVKSSRSNSSLEDTSPTQGSPKLPSRIRKPKAPVPPMSTPQPTKPKLETKVSAPMSTSKLLDTSNFSFIDSDPTLHVNEVRSGNLRKAGSIDNIINKPDRPPKPVLTNTETQTLSRSIVRSIPMRDIKATGSVAARPVAAPRTTILRSEFEKSEENLVNLREKPAVPDRPVTLMRPSSFRAATGLNSPTSNNKIVEELSEKFAGKVRRNNSLHDGKRNSESDDGGINSSSKQQVMTSMYSVDKQQVAIVDLPPSSGSPHPTRRQLFLSGESDKENNMQKSSHLCNSTDALTVDKDEVAQLSPRDANKGVKRPQVPPPARPKSTEGAGDSTNL